MTELEQLSNFIAFYNREKENVGYTGLNNWLNEFGPEFLSSLRNTDSSADNTSDELIMQRDIMSKIENMMARFACTISFAPLEIVRQSIQLEKFRPELELLLKMHRNTVSTAVNQKDDKYSNRGETESKIAFKNSLRHQVGKLVTADQELDQIVENIVNFFVDTVNPVFRALNDSDEQSIIK